MVKETLQLIDQFWDGFVQIIPRLIFSIILLIIAHIIGKKISGLIIKRLSKGFNDLLLSNFIGKIAKWIFVLIAIVISMEVLGLANFAGGIIAGAGLSAVVIGFAFKDIGENFLSGIILAFNRPFSIGDVVETEKIAGTILTLDLRVTTIRTYEGYDVYVPNSMIVKNPLINFNKEGKRRFDFTVGIDYDADVNKARSLILDSLHTVKEILQEPAPFIILSELTANSVNLRILFWVDALIAERNLLEVKGEVIEKTVLAFKEGGVKIPYDSVQIQFGKGIPEIPVNIIDTENKKIIN